MTKLRGEALEQEITRAWHRIQANRVGLHPVYLLPSGQLVPKCHRKPLEKYCVGWYLPGISHGEFRDDVFETWRGMVA